MNKKSMTQHPDELNPPLPASEPPAEESVAPLEGTEQLERSTGISTVPPPQTELKTVPPPPNLTSNLRKVPHRATIAGDLGKSIVSIFTWSIKASFYIAAGLLIADFWSGVEIQVIESDSGKIEITYDYDQQEVNSDRAFEVFKTVSSVMAGPLGFVLGFYFREERDQT
ncbi:MAG: hypothetical protein AAFP09_02685 [Cyanobacteria bacterium J06607_10]